MNRSVSVIIPVFNGQDYIAEALASVISQSCQVLEIIVVDDGSTDSTARVIAAVQAPFVHYVRQERAGISAARNHGIRLARGPLVAFLDADDLWLAGKLSLQVGSLLRSEGDMIFCHAEEFISPDRWDDLHGRVKVRGGVRPSIYASATLMRLEDCHRVGPFDPQWQIGEFVEWYARACDIGLKPFIRPEVLVRRRIHGANTGRRHTELGHQYAEIAKTILDRRRRSQ